MGAPGAGDAGRISRGVYVLAALLVPLNAWWLTALLQQGAAPGLLTVFGHVVLLLFALAALNRGAEVVGRVWRVARRRRLAPNAQPETRAPRPLFTRAEMLFLYVTLGLTTSLMGGYDFLPALTQVIHAPFAYPPLTGDWAQAVLPYLPERFTVRDAEALDFRTAVRVGLYHTEWRPVAIGPLSITAPVFPYVAPWVGPILAWTVFLTAMMGTSLCLSLLVRRRWIMEERLAFPLVRLPLALTEPGAPLFGKPVFWIGFLLAAGLSAVNGLHRLLPMLPEFPVSHQIPEVIGSQSLRITFYPFIIGLAFFMPVEVLLSLWAFAILGIWQRSVGAGAEAVQWYAPYVLNPTGQLFGRYLAVAMFALAPLLRLRIADLGLRNGDRGRATESGQHRSTGGASIRNPQSAIRNPQSALVLGAAAGFLVMLVFCVLGGMQWWVALVFLACYFAIVLALARLRAEMGPPLHDLWYNTPVNATVAAVGPLMDRSSLGMMGLLYGFNRNILAHPMPQQLEALKIGQEARMPARPLVVALLVYGVWGLLCTFWAQVHFIYHPNATWSRQMVHADQVKQLSGWLHNAPQWDGEFWGAQSVGFATMGALIMAGRAFLGWPLHPIGYLLSGSWWTDFVFVPALVAWMVKLPVMRYGGVRTYARFLPFFIGLAVGDFAMGSFWPLMGALTGTRMYAFFP